MCLYSDRKVMRFLDSSLDWIVESVGEFIPASDVFLSSTV